MHERFLKDRVVLIPGADHGFGLDLARAVCKSGATSVLSGADEARLKEAAKRLMRDKLQSLFAPLDVTDEEAVQDVFNGVHERFGKLDAVIYNAGAGRLGPVTDQSLDDWYYQLQLVLTGGFLCLREALRVMGYRREGRILVVNSAAARRPLLGPNPAYRACRAGLGALVEDLREEAGRLGIEVVHLLLPADEMAAWDSSDSPPSPLSKRFDAMQLAEQVVRLLDPNAPVVAEEIELSPPREAG